MSNIDILNNEWQGISNTSPATITMDGSPIHSILDTINKQNETLKTIITQHNNVINDIKDKTENIINNNNKLDEKIISLENKENPLNKLQPIIDLHEQQINELIKRPIYDNEQLERLSNVEKKLASFYGNDTNILGRVGHLEDGRLRDQENLANLFSQIKTLNESINHIKKDINQLKPSIKNEILNELNLQRNNNNNNDNNEDNDNDDINKMKKQISEIQPNYVKKEEINKLKDLINYVTNDCHREINELKKNQIEQTQLINEQQEEIKHLKNQKDKFSSSNFSPANTMNFSQNQNSHSLDELSNRLLTLEIRFNQLNHPSIISSSPSSSQLPLSQPLNHNLMDIINQMKKQIQDNELSVDRNTLRIDDIEKQIQLSDENIENLNQLQTKNHLFFNEEFHKLNQKKNDILKQIQDLDDKYEKLQSNVKDISEKIKLSPSSNTISGNITPPKSTSSPIVNFHTPQSSYPYQSLFLPESTTNFNKSQPIIVESLNPINEEQLNDKFKIIVEELQKSLHQIRKDMNKKHKELENMIDKSLLHCESCEGILHKGTGNFTNNGNDTINIQEINNNEHNIIDTTPQKSEKLNDNNKLEKKDELNHTFHLKKDGDMDGTINLLTFRRCKRKCAVCQQREVNGILQKETLERINQLTEQINKINRKLEKHHEKHQNTTVKYDKVILGVEELKNNILQELQREMARLNEQKISREDLLSSVLGIISQYNQEEINNQSQVLAEQLTRVRSELTYLITTNNEVYQEELNKLNKSLKIQSNTVGIHETELENLKRLIQKTQESFTTYITNPVGLSTSASGSPTLLRSISSDNIADIRMEFNQMKQNIEKYSQKLLLLEENNLQMDESNKKTRVFMDLVREEMKTIHKDNKVQLQSIKNYLDNDLNNKMINLINETLEKNSHLLNKEIILVLKDENEKLKRNQKTLEKRIYNISDSVNEKIGNENERIKDNNEKIIHKIQQIENDLNKHLQFQHQHQHHQNNNNNNSIYPPLTSIYIPSFPPNSQIIQPQSLSSPLYPPQSSSSPIYSPTTNNNADNSLKSSFPSQFRSNILKTSQTENDNNSSTNLQNDNRNNDLTTAEFQDYVHNILNPESKDKNLLPKGNSQRPKSATQTSPSIRKQWNPRAYN